MAGKKNLLSIGEASEHLGVSIDTLRRWEKKNRLTAYRSPGGHRYFEKDELDNLFGKKYQRSQKTIRKKKKTSPRDDSKINLSPETYASPIYPFTPVEAKPSSERPAREVRIPPHNPIKILEVLPQLTTQEGILKTTSILTPSQTQTPSKKIPENKKVEQSPKIKPLKLTKEHKYLLFGIITILMVITILIIVLGANRQIISPVP